jgi:hypothetical protein
MTSNAKPSRLDMLAESTIVILVCLWIVYLQIFKASKKHPSSFKQILYGCAGIMILLQIVQSLMH